MELVPHLVTLLVGLLGGGAVWGYLRDRKKAGAEGQVATQTIDIQVEAFRLQSLETRFALAERAWDEEREVLVRRIATAEERETRLEERLATKDQELIHLKGELERVEADVKNLNNKLADVLSRGGSEQL